MYIYISAKTAEAELHVGSILCAMVLTENV
jgi:hypothetical protein